MDITELEAVAAEKRDICASKYTALKEHVRASFTKHIPIEIASFCSVVHMSDSNAQIEVKLPNEKRGRDFDMYFHRPWGDEVQKLELNFGCFGSFSSVDETEVKYCIALGWFASHLHEIEQELLFSEAGKKAFAEYYAARSESYSADNEVRTYYAEQKNREFEAKKADILRKLVAGAKINPNKTDWNNTPIIYEVEKVMRKNLMFDHFGERVAIDEVVNKIMSSKWSFA